MTIRQVGMIVEGIGKYVLDYGYQQLDDLRSFVKHTIIITKVRIESYFPSPYQALVLLAMKKKLKSSLVEVGHTTLYPLASSSMIRIALPKACDSVITFLSCLTYFILSVVVMLLRTQRHPWLLKLLTYAHSKQVDVMEVRAKQNDLENIGN
uniref:Uncharacterized protein n=1 Tax=Glossina brevipalpis TaxID=37001 RepID=A0A1A9WUG0_9MUSC